MAADPVTLDRYVLEEPLGEGGAARVFRAYDTQLGRRVALKLLRLDDNDDPARRAELVARLLREARAAASLDHPNCVALYDIGNGRGEDGTVVPYLAMEYVPGQALRAYVGDPTVTLHRRARWLCEVAWGLGAAHAKGLLHRDVKPENVIIRDDDVAKLADFGVVRRLPATLDVTGLARSLGAATITQDGVLVGTPEYMSPEQLCGEALDASTDQFSWGVVAYELLAGEPPWSGCAGILRLAGEIMTKVPDPPSRKNPQVGPALDGVVLRALEKNRAARFSSMSELASAFEAASTACIASAPAPVDQTPAAAPTLTPAAALRSRRSSWRLYALALATAGVVFVMTLLAMRWL